MSQTVATKPTKVKIAGDARDANARQWAARAPPGKVGSLDGAWSSRWNGGNAGKEWVEGTATVKQVGNRVCILYKDRSGTYLIEAKRQVNTLVGRYLAQRQDRESTPWRTSAPGLSTAHTPTPPTAPSISASGSRVALTAR